MKKKEFLKAAAAKSGLKPADVNKALDAILETLTRMGVCAYAAGDQLTIEGHSLESRILNGTLLKGGDYTSYHDHRMAMALTVASLGADGPVNIDDTACVAKSFPGFFDTWRQAAPML